MRVLGVDYDETFSVHPEAWAESLTVLKRMSFKIIGVTFRNREEPITCPHYHGVCEEIVYTAGQAKHPTCLKLGLKVDIWIDDNPNWVHLNWYDVYGSTGAPWVQNPENLVPVRLKAFADMPLHPPLMGKTDLGG